mgnify:CR=1 FL=1
MMHWPAAIPRPYSASLPASHITESRGPASITFAPEARSVGPPFTWTETSDLPRSPFSAVSGIGSPGNNRHEIAAPDEGFTDDFAPFEGGGETDTFATRTFTGRYSFAFSGLVANMDGTWPAALD